MLHSIDQTCFVDAIRQNRWEIRAYYSRTGNPIIPLFQTDGGLNTVHVNAGLQDPQSLIRIMLFKRKQSSPERLIGRNCYVRYGLVNGDDCDYNVKFCMQCPDCIYYGFAIGKAVLKSQKCLLLRLIRSLDMMNRISSFPLMRCMKKAK
jgi:CRISPR-associated protein Csc2